MNDTTPAPPPAEPATPEGEAEASRPRGVAAIQRWLRAHRVEVSVFAASFAVLASFSSQRFLRQSEAPHFVYQAKAWLEGRQDVDPEVLPNLEDWACVRQGSRGPERCARPLRADDRWYSSFPAFPSFVMLPFVALHGYQLNDTSFGVIVAALSLALFAALLRRLRHEGDSARTAAEDALLTVLLGFGTLFFSAAIRGEVWFSAEIMGVGLTSLYLIYAVRARRPALAGLFWSMAVLTRTPLLFTGLFFVLEAFAPTPGRRLAELSTLFRSPLDPERARAWRSAATFCAGAAPLALLAAWSNWSRFGSPFEFGHRFFFENRVNGDIDTHGLFALHYLARNLDAAFLKLPLLSVKPLALAYDPWGLSLFLTLPVLVLAFVPPARVMWARGLALAATVVLAASALAPQISQVGERPLWLFALLAATGAAAAWFAWRWCRAPEAPRLLVPTLLTLAACAGPGLVYQNTGYMQFGFRFSIDYTPYVLLLLGIGGWPLLRPRLITAVAMGLGLAVNFWGAVAFRGYTELVRRWL